MLLTVFNLIFTGLECPNICHSPRSDDLQVRCQCFDGQLKTDLVISLSGSAVADSGSPFFSRDLNKFFCDHGTSHGSPKQVLMLINGTGLYTRHNVVITKFINNVFNI